MKKSFSTNYGSAYNSSIEDFLDSKEGKALQGKVQLIFTSPPFPLVVPKKYGNKIGEDYLNWMAELSPRLSNLNIVRENVFDSIRFFLETDDVEFTEKIISIEELE